MKAVWIGKAILRLRFKACAAWHLYWGQPGQSTRLALRAREMAEGATTAANILEALERLFGCWMRPGKGGAR